VASLTVVYG